LAFWPVMAVRRRARAPVLAFPFAVSAAVVTLGLLTWFTLEIHGSHRGVAERLAALAEAVWPLVVAIGTRRGPTMRRPRQLTPISSASVT
jgi:hypothetical protein